MEPVAVIGLGNPGALYRETRHNLGFMVVEELARRWARPFSPGRGPYLLAERDGSPEERRALLVLPSTFMNGSGEAAIDLCVRFGLQPASLLVVMDDFWLPLGTLRFRRRGSDGGHNGLASILGSLGTEEVPRLRLGIGRSGMPPKAAMADFVLSPFAPEERPLAADMVVRAAGAVEKFVRTGTMVPLNPPAGGGEAARQ